MSSFKPRPPTSKARGICRYFKVPRGCFAGDKCKFLHSETSVVQDGEQPELTPYDKSKRCRYYANGFCRRGEECWFLHVLDSKEKGNSMNAIPEEEVLCSICFEKPVTYGLLGGCSHIFCITCIKQWRDPSGKQGDVVYSGNTKKCPMCRTPSKYIIPSSVFWKQGDGEKEKVVDAYKESMARVPCRYFQGSKNKGKRSCPFGKDCFYRHANDDGTLYEFKDGADVCLPRYHMRIRPGMSGDDLFPFPLLTSVPFFTAGGMEIVINHTNLNVPHHRLRRMAARGRSQEGGVAPGIQNPRGRDARTRLREVGMSLEVLNDAIFEGATLDRLNDAVEALRTGLGRLEGNVNMDDAEEREEYEVMDRLENLADQMLASLHVLRGETENTGGGNGSETPPPRLESTSLDDDERRVGRTSAPPLVRGNVVSNRRRRRVHDGNTSDDSMPALQSVSNSSSSENEHYSDNDDDSLSGHGDSEPIRSFDLAYEDERVFGRLGRALSLLESVGGQTTDHREGDRTDGDQPAVETVNPELRIPVSHPPFVTDGRGRVVWTSPADAPVPASAPGNGAGGFPTDERGPVAGTNSESDAGGPREEAQVPSQRSLLGRMFGALF